MMPTSVFNDLESTISSISLPKIDNGNETVPAVALPNAEISGHSLFIMVPVILIMN